MKKLSVGIKGTCALRVEERHTANRMKSGTLEVFATPSVVALAEECAWTCIQDCLTEGQTTVGTFIQVKHISPTPIGMSVTCQTDLIKIEGRKLTFTFEVFDDTDKIAFGTHERFIIDTPVFLKKASEKRKNNLK